MTAAVASRVRSSSPTGRRTRHIAISGRPHSTCPASRRATADVPRRGRRRSPPSRRPGRARHRRRRARAVADRCRVAGSPRTASGPGSAGERGRGPASAAARRSRCDMLDEQGQGVVGVLGQGSLDGLEVELADLGRQLGELRVLAELARVRSSGRRAAATSARDRWRGSRPPREAGSAFPRRPLSRVGRQVGVGPEDVHVQLGDDLLGRAAAGLVQPDPPGERGLGRRQPDLPVVGRVRRAGRRARRRGRSRSIAPRTDEPTRMSGWSRVSRTRSTTIGRATRGRGRGLRVATICCSAFADW